MLAGTKMEHIQKCTFQAEQNVPLREAVSASWIGVVTLEIGNEECTTPSPLLKQKQRKGSRSYVALSLNKSNGAGENTRHQSFCFRADTPDDLSDYR